MRVTGLVLGLAMALWGCGGGAEEPPAEQTAGAETPVAADEAADGEMGDEEAAEEPMEDEEAPAPSGPAHVTYSFKVKGEPVKGTVKVRADTGEVLKEAATGERFELPSGAYRVECSADKAVLVDGPTQWDELDLAPGDDTQQEVEFHWAKVRLIVNLNGKPAKRGTVTLKRRGEEVATLPVGEGVEHVLISPGRYSAIVRAGVHEIEVEQIMIPGEATRNVPINVNF